MTEIIDCHNKELPRWIPKEEECLWCHQLAQLPYAIKNTGKELYVWYACSNPECEHQRRRSSPALYGLLFSDARSVELLKQFMTASIKPAVSVDKQDGYEETSL